MKRRLSVQITQQIQKEERVDKRGKDWNELQLWFWKLVSLRVFQNSFLFVTIDIMSGRHICYNALMLSFTSNLSLSIANKDAYGKSSIKPPGGGGGIYFKPI